MIKLCTHFIIFLCARKVLPTFLFVSSKRISQILVNKGAFRALFSYRKLLRQFLYRFRSNKAAIAALFLAAILLSPSLPLYANTSRPQIYAEWKAGKLHESIDYSFIPDRRAIGEWELHDFTENIDHYNPLYLEWDIRDFYFRSKTVYDYGRVQQQLKSGAVINSLWTNGFIVNEWNNTVSEYEIKRIYGTEYMFVTLKDDAYIRTGRQQGFYILKKVSGTPKNNNAALYQEVKKEYDTLSKIPLTERKAVTGMNIPIRIMWLIYTDGWMNGKQYLMTDKNKQTIFTVMDEFKIGVEKATDQNIKIQNEYVFIQRKLDITGALDKNNAYITQELVKQEIDRYAPPDQYDFVFTTSAIDTWPVRGVSANIAWVEQGYISAYFADDDLFNTSTAVHEFIHAFEIDTQPGIFPGILIPNRHALTASHTGYEAYAPGNEKNEQADRLDDDYHMREFEKDFFKSAIEQIDPVTGEKRYVGMFPSMWKYYDRTRKTNANR